MKMMKKVLTLSLFLAISAGFFSFQSASADQAHGASFVFDIQPRAITNNPSGRVVNVKFIITAYPNELGAWCGPKDAIKWKIAEDIAYAYDKDIKTGILQIDSTQGKQYDVSASINPLTLPPRGTEPTRAFYAVIECNTTTASNIATSGDNPVTLNVQGGLGSKYACIDGSGKYSCSAQSGSAGNAPNCSTAMGCTGLPCFSIASDLCGKTATNFSYGYKAGVSTYVCSPTWKPDCSDAPGYQNQQCVKIPSNYCGTSATPPPGTEDQTYQYQITNPLAGGPTNIFEVFDIASGWMLKVSIPLAVLFILYAGLLFLIARDDTNKVKQARTILKNVVIGLAIIMIGRGFVTLIESIIQLGDDTPASDCAPGRVCDNGPSGDEFFCDPEVSDCGS